MKFAFLERPLPTRSPRQHMEDVRREFFKRKLDMIADDTEQAIDYCRDLIRSNADVSEELKELECTANSLLLVALLLKREASK